jgi:pseudouridine-5'-phosphate glycosidase
MCIKMNEFAPRSSKGGTGGVHRGGELSLDISTDLIELSRTPVVVVSAGVKSILDIKRTLEVLETFGVPTGAWKSDEFPAFFSPISGVRSPARFDCARDVASAYLVGKSIGMSNGILVVSLCQSRATFLSRNRRRLRML